MTSINAKIQHNHWVRTGAIRIEIYSENNQYYSFWQTYVKADLINYNDSVKITTKLTRSGNKYYKIVTKKTINTDYKSNNKTKYKNTTIKE